MDEYTHIKYAKTGFLRTKIREIWETTWDKFIQNKFVAQKFPKDPRSIWRLWNKTEPINNHCRTNKFHTGLLTSNTEIITRELINSNQRWVFKNSSISPPNFEKFKPRDWDQRKSIIIGEKMILDALNWWKIRGPRTELQQIYWNYCSEVGTIQIG